MPELIDTAWIAQRMACRRDYVTDRLTKRPDFPRPVINITQKMRRWSREDVEAWIARKVMPNARAHATQEADRP